MKLISALALASLSVAATSGVALAGPEAAVTFKNNSDFDADYDPVSISAYTYAHADPKPPARVGTRSSTVFKVKGPTADVTSVIFQYKIGRKVCRFKTSYLKLPGRNGAPKWNKSVEESGGARCEVKITAVNYSNHDWAAEFTMR
ncbi:hypothetical protein [Pseudomonas caspiana]|uniref:DUF4426 domain-containing protein n=1 Tax=Pseudomonas caspiana TaxID=1451454 RepID=A0A1Y3NXF5_9PSED|nr:hypothetical protein [Pseudomonas caspiana]OUM72259.1 hypothetical protein AUC60_19115 [Pseudomonas caspiana]